MDKVCDTCLYGIRVEDNKLGCRYPGICHTQDGEKTAWTPNKAAQYADLKGRECDCRLRRCNIEGKYVLLNT